VGEPNALSPKLIKDALALYRLLDVEDIRAAQQFKEDHDWSGFKKNLIKKLTDGFIQQTPFVNAPNLR